jgi:hypothetical protein
VYFLLPYGGLSQKPKHVASNKTDIKVVVTDGLYFLFEGGDDDGGDDDGRMGTAAVATSCFLFLLTFTLMMNGQATMLIDSRGIDAILARFFTSFSGGKK